MRKEGLAKFFVDFRLSEMLGVIPLVMVAMNSNRGGDGSFGRAKAAAVSKYATEYGPESPEWLGLQD